MANELITSFFTSSAAPSDEPEIDKQETVKELTRENRVVTNGFSLDLGGLIQSSQEKKRKRTSSRKKTNLQLAHTSQNVVIVNVSHSEKKARTCEKMDTEQEKPVCPLSPANQKTSLSSSWQQVFGRQQKKSPIRKTISSPKRCRSPQQPAQCRSPRRQNHCPKSPLKQSVKRQLMTTPTSARGPPPIYDHAPYNHLVHVRQSLPSYGSQPPTSLVMKEVPRPPLMGDLHQSLGLSEHCPLPPTLPPFDRVTDPSTSLKQLEMEHPSICISDLYSRYCSLTRKTHPSSGSSLRCSIAVKVGVAGKITVDHSLYPRPYEVQDHMHSDLWSSIYRPRKCSEVIGNSIECSQLQRWLKQWKARTTPEPTDKKVARRPLRSHRKTEEWWFSERDEDFILPGEERRGKRRSGLSRKYLEGDSDAESADDDDVMSVMVLCGPHGSGKTAAVYACAQELGFGVYEVNSSSSRGRSQMLSTLREVSLSHLVSQRKRNGLTMVEREKQAPKTVALENNTLILLEEVDVLFEDEEKGFWSAVYEIIRTTKRPFVMTCTDDKLRLTCPHSQLFFARPPQADLAIHICLLSLAHGVSLSSQASNQIVSSFNSDIRKTFHFMHTWLSWLPSNHTEAPPPSSKFPSPFCLSTEWRGGSTTPSHLSYHQSDLYIATATADNLSTLDLLTPSEEGDHAPWWRVVPVNYLLDELSTSKHNDLVLTQTKRDIESEIIKLSRSQPHHQQRSVAALHHSLNTCSKSLTLFWQLERSAVAMEGLPFLRLLSILENHRKVFGSKRRFQHYLKYFGISNEHLSVLADENFFTSK